MFDPAQYAADGFKAGCPLDQMQNFIRAGIILQSRQLAASAAARLCDQPNGPTAIGYGGARGGGKSHWLLAQMGADDCQRVPGLKCLLLRKVGKSNLENFEDLRLRVFGRLKHSFNASRGILVFENGSRIIAKHYQHENEIDAFLGLEYDVIGIEEATTLSYRKYQDITTCCRSSKLLPLSAIASATADQLSTSTASGPSTINYQPSTAHWRPRIYSTTNPGGIGHEWYKSLFVDPYLARQRLQCVGDDVRSRGPSALSAAPTEIPKHGNTETPASAGSLATAQPSATALATADQLCSRVSEVPITRETLNPQLSAQPSTINHQPSTLFIPARVDDNIFTNPEYKTVLASRTGWQKDAWYHGRWDIAAGQFFSTFRHDVHVIDQFDYSRAVHWCASMDYGYTHYTVVLLGCLDADDNLYIIDEHAERLWVPQRHVPAIRAMLARHGISTGPRSSDSSPISPSSASSVGRDGSPSCPPSASSVGRDGSPSRPFQALDASQPYSRVSEVPTPRETLNPQPSANPPPRFLGRFLAGADIFSSEYDGTTIAARYRALGFSLRPANPNRAQGWLAILQRLGDPDHGIKPSLFIHKRCTRLLDSLPYLQHDPDEPADVLKINTSEDGFGGDDAADALRYMVATPRRVIIERNLSGL